MKREKFNPSPEYLLFLSKLRLARMEAGVSQRELARRVGIHHSRVVRSEAQPPQRALHIVEARAWLQALGLNIVGFTMELEAALGANDAASNDEDAMSHQDGDDSVPTGSE